MGINISFQAKIPHESLKFVTVDDQVFYLSKDVRKILSNSDIISTAISIHPTPYLIQDFSERIDHVFRALYALSDNGSFKFDTDLTDLEITEIRQWLYRFGAITQFEPRKVPKPKHKKSSKSDDVVLHKLYAMVRVYKKQKHININYDTNNIHGILKNCLQEIKDFMPMVTSKHFKLTRNTPKTGDYIIRLRDHLQQQIVIFAKVGIIDENIMHFDFLNVRLKHKGINVCNHKLYEDEMIIEWK